MRTDGGTFECLRLDLTCLKSVRSFAGEVLRKKIPVHVLANNGETTS